VSVALSVQDVQVRFGPLVALDGITLDVTAGEVVALLGPSGCGKSTLLRVVAGLQPPDRGRVLLDGVDQAAIPAHRRGVGLMFQDHALFPHRDVGANVSFGLRMRGDPPQRREARVAEVLELVGLPGFQRRAVGELSGGERQRVALARTLAPEPRVLMLDEPLGALDRSLRERLVLELRALFDRLDLTVVHVTHDQGEALAIADRVVLVRGGRVVQQGTPRAVWTAPADDWVADFLGFANIVDLEVRAGVGRTAWGLEIRGLELPDGAARVVLRAGGVGLGDAAAPGGVPGVVAGVAFRGEDALVRVAVADGPELAAGVVPGSEPVIGDEVVVCVAPWAVAPLAPSG
jgi:thiamine transport system ATP-binding protein